MYFLLIFIFIIKTYKTFTLPKYLIAYLSGMCILCYILRGATEGHRPMISAHLFRPKKTLRRFGGKRSQQSGPGVKFDTELTV